MMCASAYTKTLEWNSRTRSFSGKTEDYRRGRLSPGASGRRRAEVSPEAKAFGDQAEEIRPEGLEDLFARHVWSGRWRRQRVRGICLRTFPAGVAANGAGSSGASGADGKSLRRAGKHTWDF